MNGNYIRINKFDKLDSLNISISYDSNSIELGLPMTESSNNDLTDFSFKEGSLIIKSNPEYKKLNFQDEDHSILIPLSITNNEKSFFLSFKDYFFSGENDKVIECSAESNLNIKDLTGAGDLFAAGFLHGYINNLTTKESLKKGTEMSSKIIQKIGARLS